MALPDDLGLDLNARDNKSLIKVGPVIKNDPDEIDKKVIVTNYINSVKELSLDRKISNPIIYNPTDKFNNFKIPILAQ